MSTRFTRELSEHVACTLADAEMQVQQERWNRLLADAATSRVETADGLRLVLGGDTGVEEELRALVAVENRCCSWAEFTVARDGDALVMDACSRGDGVATLHGMFLGG